MIEDDKPACARTPLAQTQLDYIAIIIDAHGLDALAQAARDICEKKTLKHGVDATRLTAEEKRQAQLWRFGKDAFERCLKAILDHGPGSGCR